MYYPSRREHLFSESGLPTLQLSSRPTLAEGYLTLAQRPRSLRQITRTAPTRINLTSHRPKNPTHPAHPTLSLPRKAFEYRTHFTFIGRVSRVRGCRYLYSPGYLDLRDSRKPLCRPANRQARELIRSPAARFFEANSFEFGGGDNPPLAITPHWSAMSERGAEAGKSGIAPKSPCASCKSKLLLWRPKLRTKICDNRSRNTRVNRSRIFVRN